jgi:hypothetical protein
MPDQDREPQRALRDVEGDQPEGVTRQMERHVGEQHNSARQPQIPAGPEDEPAELLNGKRAMNYVLEQGATV